jgi:hypothetical protein
MKSIRNIAFSALLTFGAFGAITYTACNKDECKDVVCQNGGTCSEGNCTCATGYEGTNCETVSAKKFIGTGAWNVSEPSCGGNYTTTVSTGTKATSIIIANLGNFTTPSMVVANADKNSLVINSYTDPAGRVFTGSGTFSGDSYSITYTVTYSDGDSETCTAVFSAD